MFETFSTQALAPNHLELSLISSISENDVPSKCYHFEVDILTAQLPSILIRITEFPVAKTLLPLLTDLAKFMMKRTYISN